MPKFNYLFFLNSYSDLQPTTAPQLNNFKWSREISGVPYTIENSQQIQVPALSTSPNIIPYPFSTLQASTTGATTSGSASITGLASTVGIAVGQLVVSSDLPVGTVILSISGSTITISQNAASSNGASSLSFYQPASFVYMESDQEISMIYNGGSPMALNPFEINGIITPGVFFMNGPCYSLTITNPGSTIANIFFASMG